MNYVISRVLFTRTNIYTLWFLYWDTLLNIIYGVQRRLK
jgi:hypothetical protein